jgi:hypothetical protein
MLFGPRSLASRGHRHVHFFTVSSKTRSISVTHGRQYLFRVTEVKGAPEAQVNTSILLRDMKVNPTVLATANPSDHLVFHKNEYACRGRGNMWPSTADSTRDQR